MNIRSVRHITRPRSYFEAARPIEVTFESPVTGFPPNKLNFSFSEACELHSHLGIILSRIADAELHGGDLTFYDELP